MSKLITLINIAKNSHYPNYYRLYKMGNESSNIVYINLNSLTYSAGDYLKAKVYVKITEPITSESLKIRFSGYEATEFTKNNTIHKGHSEILNYEFHIHK